MVTGGSHQDDGDKNHPPAATVSRAGASRSWGTTTISGQSVSTSGSIGSPSSRILVIFHVMVVCINTIFMLVVGDGLCNKKKKRGQRAAGADKSGRGLRQFSMKVCEKVESKGTTTYNEVADELVAEFADPSNSVSSPDQAERLGLRNRIEKKTAYLQELEEQYIGLQNLIHRNEQLYGSENAPSGGVSLPFILVQTRPHATVEVEISEDMQLVHFDFNSTPFELHDDNYVLKAMKFCERPQSDDMAPNLANDGGEGSSMSNMFQQQILPSPGKNTPIRPPTSPPIPGIIKARVKHEH
ncbi:hypothetical protein GH714_039052 [Hevea brasiliensis]|uniref:Transcription factor DP C-terminal domain-containing protein n=1 Tax=Hevea brasiliensis TaxID=3981 RepID=A0A6A6KMC4_HEVBR|nr:hypothetical protein GH714_039052 [Hevea brasiliensis]